MRVALVRSRGVAAVVGTAALVASLAVAPSAKAAPVRSEAVGSIATLTVQQRAEKAYAAMSTTERIGQLFMVGVPASGTSKALRAKLHKYGVGNVYLSGNNIAGATTMRTRIAKVRKATTREGVRPYVSADQEGGQVQHLRGPGFSRMPSALAQGRTSLTKQRTSAKKWAKQLAKAGVNLDLAPVADVVPRSKANSNKPIGQWDREYGHTVGRVSNHVQAFARGMRDAHVSTTVKHFPGLGRATGNTDDAHGVTDPTTRHSPYLRPFRAGIVGGASFLMVSSATYPHIDRKHRACFSPTVMRTMVRTELGFGGVVVSDSFESAAVHAVSPGKRATLFLAAGGTMVLVTSASHVAAMTKAVRTKAAANKAFAAQVRAAVMKVLTVKANAGLLG